MSAKPPISEEGPSTGAGPCILQREVSEHVVELILNRPEKLNSINREMITSLVDAVERCSENDDVRVIILSGAGRAFSAGADASSDGVTRITSASDQRDDYLRAGWGRFLRLWELPIPIIVQVHGYCLGIATVLCNLADIVVVDEEAEIGWPALPMGGGVISPTWAYYVGIRKAKEFSFMSGSHLSGKETAELGWANRAVPHDQLADEVRSMAARMARTPRGLLRLKKDAINQVFDRMGFRDSIRLGPSWGALAHTDPGAEEVMDIIRQSGLKEAMALFRD